MPCNQPAFWISSVINSIRSTLIILGSFEANCMANRFIKRINLRLASVFKGNHWPVMVWLTLVVLTLFSTLLAEGPQQKVEGEHLAHINQLSVLLVAGIVLSKGTLVIDYFMGLKHSQGWPVRIMKGFLVLMLGLITLSCFYY